ncbi:hypothetical protein Tco_1301090 [Tanacetum coccineum]
MADLNIPANDAPMEQAPAVAPPTRTDDQILPVNKWEPIGKINRVLDVLKSQRNPIFPIAVALLKNTNFFRAFTASSTIPAIYIQQFLDTMCFNSYTGLYSCQLDEQWLNLHKDLLRDALDITPSDDNNPFVAPPSSDTVIDYVNTLGYPSTLRNVSAMSVNALYQPWRAVLSMINMKNLATASRGKKKTALLLIQNVRFTKLIIHHLRTKHNIHPRTGSPLHYSHDENVLNTLRFVGKDGREIFGMPTPDALLTDEIKGAPYYSEYQEHVAKYQQFLDEEHGKAEEGEATKFFEATKVTKAKAAKVTKPAGDKAPKPTTTQPPKPKPVPTKPSKAISKKKRKLVKEIPDEPSPAKRSKGGLVGKRHKPKSPLRLVDEPSDEGVPKKEPVVNEEEANIQRALELIQGKEKEKVVEEQAAHDLLILQTPKKKSPVDQFIFQRRTPMPTKASGHAEYPSLDAELALTDSETESDEEVLVSKAGVRDEGQAGPNPGVQDEDQVGSNPGDAAEFQPQPSHVVHAGPNLEHMDLEATDASTQQKPEQMDEEFTITAYPKVQENLKLPTEDQFFVEKPQEEEPGKTNAEAEVQSLVSVPIHQDTSSVPPITTPVIDPTTMQSDSPLPTSTATTSIITTTITTLPPPPPQPQQSTTNLISISRIGELEQHMADLIQNNLALEESQAVDEIVIDAIDWAMQASLRARFRDLPTVDMKEILQQRMFEDNSYKTHDVHNDLYEALQQSLELDYSNQRLVDQEEARKKRRKRRDGPRTPHGSPPSHPPPPPPLAGASGAPSTLGASGSSQFLPPPPPLFTGTSGPAHQQGSKALTGVSEAQELSPPGSLMHKDSIPDEQTSDPEPAWTIPSSNKSDVANNWASALATTYEPPAENSLLAKTRDMTTFMKWYYRQVNKTELTQADFEGQAYEVVKAFDPNVIHLQF